MNGLLTLLGRFCLSLVFLWAGLAKVFNLPGTVQYMASKQMPLIAVFLPLAIAIQLLGGLSILLGYKARYGAALLIVFIIPAALIFHDFWNLQNPERLTQQIMFMKDVAILGALLQILTRGPGPWSLDRS